ncbi:MAG TPA: hypothetical protein DDY68_04080 [Porphyromonadaceae bacterium]|nr:hypothetical protein [Porphyromonadaceae bacterium]
MKIQYVVFANRIHSISKENIFYLHRGMGKVLLLLFLLLCSLSSCKEEEAPISQQEFTDILYELHLSEAYIERGNMKNKENIKLDLYHTILSKHNVGKVDFDSAVSWYSNRPHVYRQIYEDLKDRVSTALDENNKQSAQSKEITPDEDSVDIWRDRRVLLFSSLSSVEMYRFYIPADSNFRKGDCFRFFCNLSSFHTIAEEGHSFEIKVDVFERSGKVQTQTLHPQRNMQEMICIELPQTDCANQLLVSMKQVSSSGYFSPFWLKDIKLFRVHRKKE